MTTDLHPGGITEKRMFLCLAEKWLFDPNIRFFPKKKYPKFAKILIFIWEKGTFLFAQFFPVVARTWLESRGEIFGGPKTRIMACKSGP